MNIITYHSTAAKPEHAWVAYIVLPNGEYLGIMFRDYTEDGVKAKAEKFWSENYKPVADAAVENVKSHASELGKSNAGKVWMINETTREKRRVFPNQIEQLGAGWVRGGARSR